LITKEQMKNEIIKQLRDFVIITLMNNSDFGEKEKYNFYFYLQIIPISINSFEIQVGSNSDFGNFNLLKQFNFVQFKLNEEEIIKIVNEYDFNFVQFEYSNDIYYQFRLENDFFIEI